jgi:SAM-dependent methyltransferase
MPESHVRIAAGFDRVTCMDIVTACLGNAERKLGTAASYRCESIVTTGLPDNLFDAAFCAHVIYHIDKNEQETAVRQLIRVTRPGGRLVIIYSNPRSPLAVPGAVMRMVRRKVNAWRGLPGFHPYHYYSPLPLSWWRRFAVECDITFFPGAVFGRRQTRALVWSNRTAAALFKAAAWFETKAPHAAVRLWQFPIVVLDKKARTPGEAVVR